MPTTAPTCPPRGCPSQAAWSWVLLPKPPRAVRDVRGRGLSSCAAVRLCSNACLRWPRRPAGTAEPTSAASSLLRSFHLTWVFSTVFFFFYNRKKILQKRHICVGDSAQTQTTTAERGRECEVEMEPDYTGTPVGSWCGAAGAMGMCQGGGLSPGEEDLSRWQAVGSPASIPTRTELLARESNTERGGFFLNQHTGFALI